MSLTLDDIDNIEAAANPRKISDGGGLFLFVHPKGGKWWRLRYRFARKQNQLSLGVYPKVSLAEARDLREKYRKLLADGINPGGYRKAEKAGKLAEQLRPIAPTRFMLNSEGALSFCLGKRCLRLTAAETVELRTFLDATEGVAAKGASCR